jgi:uncharacterized membrane protein
MLWLVLAIFAAACFALTNYLDKLVISRYVKSIAVYAAYFGLMNGAAALALLLLASIEYSQALLLAFAAGVLIILSTYLYLRSMREGKLSSVVFAQFASPVFVVFLAIAFLGEILTPQKYVGIALIASGVLLPIVKKGAMLAGSKYMLLFALEVAITNIVYKYLLGFHSYASILFWYWMGTLAVAIPLLLAMRREFFATVSSLGKMNAAAWASQAAYILALVASLSAFSIQSVSVVSATLASQTLFVLAYVTVGSRLVPKALALQERQQKRDIAAKLASAALIAAGIFLLA